MAECKKAQLRLLAWEILKYWEPRRAIYNLLLLWRTIMDFYDDGAARHLLEPRILLLLCGYGVAANIVYCTAYPVDMLLQRSRFKVMWLKVRWSLWLFGCWLGLFFVGQTTGTMTGVARML